MTEFNQYVPGTFNWVDLATTDTEAAKKFYTGLFGWSFADLPAGESMVYTMLYLDGKDVAGLGQLAEEQQAQGIPPHWMSYVSVTSADEVAKKVKALGGQVIMEPFDVLDSGRMAVIQDPTGAMLSLWQPRTHIGARVANVPVSLSWNELATTDTAEAGRFYSQLFDWEMQVNESGPMIYTTFINQGRMNAGMMKIPADWGNIPPHWLVYFAVAGCKQSAEKAQALGATVLVPPTDAGDVGRFAVIQDPQGAVFAIIEMKSSLN